jgi:hypothetical protein
MRIQINNIEYNFIKQGSDYLPDDENLGLAHLLIPGRMADRFRRECGNSTVTTPDNQRILYPFPHYDGDEMDYVPTNSDHQCHNADTQIVLMNWLFDKKRKYKLTYYGLDPYWLFHDACHAENDVYCNEVSGINSCTEHFRLIEGADYAKKRGISMTGQTLHLLKQNWDRRWRSQERGYTALEPWLFLSYMSKKAQRDYEFLEQIN